MLVKKGSPVYLEVQYQSYKPHTNRTKTYNIMNHQAPTLPPPMNHRRIKPSQWINRCRRCHPHVHILSGHMHKNNSSTPCNSTKLRGARPHTRSASINFSSKTHSTINHSTLVFRNHKQCIILLFD
jgi:hypothetical protein